MIRHTRVILLGGLCSLFALSAAAQRLTREEYILKYKGIVVEQMEKYGIPASITMAQALLESDNGNSRLAIEANNHFGIKCRDWKGETILHHDDAKDECFRKYASVEESYVDHSVFLDNSPRYNSLFDLKPDDYKGWAYGLKQAGYATNPKYPEMLIKIIEDNNLYLLDQGQAEEIAYSDIKPEVEKVVIDENHSKINVDNYTVTIDRSSGRQMRYNNGVPYVLVEAGDSFSSIARDFRISEGKLLKFNDLSRNINLREGDALYVKMKSKRSENGYLTYVVKADDTMHSISQQYGIRLKNLYRINNMSMNDTIREGQQIRLR